MDRNAPVVTDTRAALTPWTPDQSKAFLRQMYHEAEERLRHRRITGGERNQAVASEGYYTTAEVCEIVGLRKAMVSRLAKELDLGRKTDRGRREFSDVDIDRIRNRPGSRRQACMHPGCRNAA